MCATVAIQEKEKSLGGIHIPIRAMTAHAISGDRERCFDAGMDGYVTKPITVQELFEAMEKIFRQNSNPTNRSATHFIIWVAFDDVRHFNTIVIDYHENGLMRPQRIWYEAHEFFLPRLAA